MALGPRSLQSVETATTAASVRYDRARCGSRNPWTSNLVCWNLGPTGGLPSKFVARTYKPLLSPDYMDVLDISIWPSTIHYEPLVVPSQSAYQLMVALEMCNSTVLGQSSSCWPVRVSRSRQ